MIRRRILILFLTFDVYVSVNHFSLNLYSDVGNNYLQKLPFAEKQRVSLLQNQVELGINTVVRWWEPSC